MSQSILNIATQYQIKSEDSRHAYPHTTTLRDTQQSSLHLSSKLITECSQKQELLGSYGEHQILKAQELLKIVRMRHTVAEEEVDWHLFPQCTYNFFSIANDPRFAD